MNRETFGSNQAYLKQRQLQFTESEMSVALQLIETVCRRDFDGTLGSLDRTVYLAQVLFQDPLNFFDKYFAAHSPERLAIEAAIASSQLDPNDWQRAQSGEFI